MTKWPIEVDVFGCWLWLAKLDRDGYGVSWRGKVATKAHIAVYRERVGEVGIDKDGKPLVLDHACRNRRCVAPHHLEPVTQSENELRKSWRYRAKRARCLKGHELAKTAVITPTGGRICRTCNREALGAT